MKRKLRFNDEVAIAGLQGRFKVLQVTGDWVHLFGVFPDFDLTETENLEQRKTVGYAKVEDVYAL
jgi:hypothetical protein